MVELSDIACLLANGLKLATEPLNYWESVYSGHIAVFKGCFLHKLPCNFTCMYTVCVCVRVDHTSDSRDSASSFFLHVEWVTHL